MGTSRLHLASRRPESKPGRRGAIGGVGGRGHGRSTGRGILDMEIDARLALPPVQLDRAGEMQGRAGRLHQGAAERLIRGSERDRAYPAARRIVQAAVDMGAADLADLSAARVAAT